MRKTFNELQQWLLQNWPAARQLEDSMANVREKYKTVFERVIEVVQEEKRELEHCRLHLTDFNGNAGFAKKEWPGQYATWPSGLWIGDISLDNLMSDEGDHPNAYITLSVPKVTQVDLEEARSTIQMEAEKLLNDKNLKCFFNYEAHPKTCFWYDLPESRQELRQMLLENESEKFVQCIASHILILARFIPHLDEALAKNKS